MKLTPSDERTAHFVVASDHILEGQELQKIVAPDDPTV
jgi:hypothetical protein